PLIEFTAKLAGYEDSSLSLPEVPRPEIFGPYLQFVFTHELSQQYDTHPPGPQGGFIVIDTRTRRIVTFDKLVVPGREKALESLQHVTFRAWLKSEPTLPSEAIRAHFSNPSHAFFPVNRNWRITEGGLMFRFAAYEVGPRPFGSPEIFVEKDRLLNIIQPDILEQIPARGLIVGN
ncbi:MAG: RsiV family protein, partial [Azoarcus sp.]|nr:RsiV family protein [Azoarcus sp.]